MKKQKNKTMKNELEQKKFKALKASLNTGCILDTCTRTSTTKGHPIGYKKGLLVGLSTATDVEVDFQDDCINVDYDLDEVKPHYFPLSYLTKEIVVEGYNDNKPFVPCHELIMDVDSEDELNWLPECIQNDMPLWAIELLHQWHFNVFNLPSDSYINAAESKVYEPK